MAENKQYNKDPKNSSNKESNKPKPKFNVYWIYGAIAVVFIGLQFLSISPKTTKIERRKVYEILEKGDVAKIVVVNREKANIYIKADRLSDPNYSELLENKFGRASKGGPHYYYTIGSIESFEDIISKVEIRARELKLAGVKTEKIKKRTLYKEIRSVGNVAYDPNLAIAQDEFLSAIRSYEKAVKGGINEIVVRAKSLVGSSRRKLLLLGLSNEQIDDIEKYKESQDNLILPGDKMWVYGYAYEYELNWIKKGSDVKVKSIGLIGEEFYGEIISINPTVDPQTRSVKFRALIDNPSKQLKPDMYVDIEIMSEYRDPQGNMEVLSIPKSALLDTGRRKVVWVDLGGGQFEGRKIVVGPEAVEQSEEQGKFYPVLKGLKEGDVVVTKGNFLIDSQSQITGVAASAYGGAIGDEEPKGSFQGLHTGH